MSSTPITTMRLDAEMLALLDELAERLGTTRTEAVRRAVRDMAERTRGTVLPSQPEVTEVIGIPNPRKSQD